MTTRETKHLISRLIQKTILNINRKFLLFGLMIWFLNACAPQISFQVQKPPEFQIQDIQYLEIGSYIGEPGSIPLPPMKTDESFLGKIGVGETKAMEPLVQNFKANPEHSEKAADLVRAQILGMLSSSSPWTIINTTGEETGMSGSIPDDARVAVLDAQIKYAELRYEDKEAIRYIVSVENKGTTFEQQLLAKAGSMGAESLGAGFLIPTPYVELLAAIEIEMSLNRKNGTRLIPPQTHRAYYVRKWGGNSSSSHMPGKIRKQIILEFQQDESFSESISTELDRTTLAVQDPAVYLSMGLNLKRNQQVPLTSLDLMIRLSRQSAEKYLKQISPYEEETQLILLSGNEVAMNLIRGNAYQEAIAYLQGLDQKTAEDEYNLGLAYEATGNSGQARIHYETALQQSPGNSQISEALSRLK